MITKEKGDLFAGSYDYISHGANTVGVMGAGIATVFRDKFPKMHTQYASAGASKSFVEGGYMFFEENGQKGYNLFSQGQPGPTASGRSIFLSLLGASHDIMVNDKPTSDNRVKFAMPLIGCGIGGVSYEEFYTAVEGVDHVFGSFIQYVIVYTDANESLVLEFDSQTV